MPVVALGDVVMPASAASESVPVVQREAAAQSARLAAPARLTAHLPNGVKVTVFLLFNRLCQMHSEHTNTPGQTKRFTTSQCYAAVESLHGAERSGIAAVPAAGRWFQSINASTYSRCTTCRK